jgi:hypothetical protein
MISPKYLMKLVKEVNDAVFAEYKSYKDVRFYIGKWHQEDRDWNNHWENFTIYLKENKEIDLPKTLHEIDGELLLKIAIDMGVETPDFIPSIPVFRIEIKSSFETASATFERAFKQIEEHPDIAVGLANSALEGIIKEILKDERILAKVNTKATLYTLASDILKVFQMFPGSELPSEVKTIGSSLLAIGQSIETLRSNNTDFHGKTGEDYKIKDPLYAYFVVNSVTTVGLFINSYYRLMFPKPPKVEEDNGCLEDDLPF